ncbi:MAG: glycosyltransferase family 8 protein, partial [Thermoleophilaceae bacterium]
LACGGDSAYLVHTAAMVSSILEHSGGLDVRVHYLHEPALDRREAAKFESFVEARGGSATLIPVAAERIAGLPAAFNHVTEAMWYRIFLSELLPDVERVLYLDADTLAMDDLRPLWETELRGFALAAVTNVWEPWNLGYPAALGLRRPYFNSGVLLMNLNRMRELDADARVADYALANRDSLTWPDQDALNVVLGDERVELYPRWNCMNSVLLFESANEVFGEEAVAEARARPGIRHFEGPAINKPWHLLGQSRDAGEYFRHRRQTPWPHVRRAGVTPRNLLLRAARALGRSPRR